MKLVRHDVEFDNYYSVCDFSKILIKKYFPR